MDGSSRPLAIDGLADVLPSGPDQHSELEKISCLLDFHYSFGKSFSAEKTFLHILKSALQISGAERGFVLHQLNRLLCLKTLSNRFVTLFLCHLEASGRGQFIRAGHSTTLCSAPRRELSPS